MIQQMLAIWSLVPLPFLKSAWTSGSSRFTYCWGLAWKFLSITLLACAAAAAAKSLQSCPTLCDDECSCVVVWTFFGIAFLWDWNESCPFPVLWPLLSFPNLLTCWVRTFTASSFRIWNSSTGIPSPPLALFVVMLQTGRKYLLVRNNNTEYIRTRKSTSGKQKNGKEWAKDMYRNLIEKETNGTHTEGYSTSLVILKLIAQW